MITHIRITPDGALVARLARLHTPNTPRTHDAHVNEPVQCVCCLQAWPCDVRQLTRPRPGTRMTSRIRDELWLWKICGQATIRLIRTRRLVATLEWLDAQLVAKSR